MNILWLSGYSPSTIGDMRDLPLQLITTLAMGLGSCSPALNDHVLTICERVKQRNLELKLNLLRME